MGWVCASFACESEDRSECTTGRDGYGYGMGLRGKGKNSPATKILTNPWAVMRVGGSWSSSCVSDALARSVSTQSLLSFPTTSSSKQPPPKTDGRARPLHGVALPLRDRLWPCSKKHQQQHPAAVGARAGKLCQRGAGASSTHRTQTRSAQSGLAPILEVLFPMGHLIIGIAILAPACLYRVLYLLRVCLYLLSRSNLKCPIFSACFLRVMPSMKTGWRHSLSFSLMGSITLSLLSVQCIIKTESQFKTGHNPVRLHYLSDRCTAESSPALPPVLPDRPTRANGWTRLRWPKPWSALGTVRCIIGSASPSMKMLVAVAGAVKLTGLAVLAWC